MNSILVCIYKPIKLLNGHHIEMLVQEEQLVLVEIARITHTLHYNIHHLLVHVNLWLHIQGVYQHGYPNRIIPYTNYEQLTELFWSDVILLGVNKLLMVIFLTVHLKHCKNVLSSNKKPLSIVLSHPWLYVVIDYNLFEVGLTVLAVGWCLHWECLLEK